MKAALTAPVTRASRRKGSDAPAPAQPHVPSAVIEERPVILGYEPDEARRWGVYYLAMALGALAVFSVFPALAEVSEHLRADISEGVNRWAWLVLLLGGMQLVYTVYLAQLPDWSTTFVVLVLVALLAAMYAAGLGIATMASQGNGVVAWLGLAVQQENGHMTGWCFVMLTLTASLAYCATRFTLRWHKQYVLSFGAPSSAASGQA